MEITEKRKKVLKHYIYPINNQNEKIINDLYELIICKDFRNTIREFKSVGISLFGSAWNNEKTNPKSIHEISNWLFEFRGKFKCKKISLETIDFIFNGIDKEKVKMKKYKSKVMSKRF